MPLVVHVEAVVDRVVLQFGHVPSHINHGHGHNASGGTGKAAGAWVRYA